MCRKSVRKYCWDQRPWKGEKSGHKQRDKLSCDATSTESCECRGEFCSWDELSAVSELESRAFTLPRRIDRDLP